MARGYLGILLVTAFVVVDCVLLWFLNTSTPAAGFAGSITPADLPAINAVLISAAIVAIFAAVLWKLKPWK